MKQPRDLARRFLDVADRDIRTLRLLAAAPDSDDEAVGFHARQSIEKCLEAVLSVNEIAFSQRHTTLAGVRIANRKECPYNKEIPYIVEIK